MYLESLEVLNITFIMVGPGVTILRLINFVSMVAFDVDNSTTLSDSEKAFLLGDSSAVVTSNKVLSSLRLLNCFKNTSLQQSL